MNDTRLLLITALFALWAACGNAFECNDPFVRVGDIEDFRKLHTCAKSIEEYKVDISLECDLDFSEWGEEYIPFGQRLPSEKSFTYSGKFFGNGHKISGLVINRTCGDLQNACLFAMMKNVFVRDLFFDSTCSFRGAWAAPLSAEIQAENVTIINVTSAANVEGCAVAGGIVGTVFVDSQKNILIEQCRNTGSVIAATNILRMQYSAGGIVGWARFDTGGNLTVRDCHNSGAVNTTVWNDQDHKAYCGYAGGIVSCEAFPNESEVLIEDCTNSGPVAIFVDRSVHIYREIALAGGIVAISSHASVSMASPAVVRRCYNRGRVDVIGYQENFTYYAGGVVAAVELVESNAKFADIVECTNNGNVSVALSQGSSAAPAAGIAATMNACVTVSSCENTGGVSSSKGAFGIVSEAISVCNSVNHGAVSGNTTSRGIALTISESAVAVVSTACLAGTEPPFVMPHPSCVKEAVFFCGNTSSTGVSFAAGEPMQYNTSTRKWTAADSEDVAATLSAVAVARRFSRGWSEELRLGHLVTFSSTVPLPGVLAESATVVAQPGETLRDLLARLGAGALLEPPYTLHGSCTTGTIAAACSVAVAVTHTLLFAVEGTHIRVDVAHGTRAPRAQLAPYLDARQYAIVRTGTTDDFFDPAAPVLASANYTVTPVRALEVVADGTVDVRDIAAAVADADTVVRIVGAEPRADGTVSVIVVVEACRVEAVVDRIQQCITERPE